MVQWTQPQGTYYGFRLVANRYGFPVDQNDGNVLINSTTFPGTSYADQNVIPGSYHYYGIYLLVNNTLPQVWERCGFASCLMPANNGMGERLYELIPDYFREALDGDLTTDAAGNQYLQQFLSVVGWGFDYLKTQYDVLYNHLNDPMHIPLGDLVNLAGELGMPFQPEVPAYIMRKAAANWTTICQQRGTPVGLSENITLLTGYPVDLQIGRNLMLENDQAQPLHPLYGAWSASIGYVIGERVLFGNYVYQCIATGGLGNAPTGTTSSNTWWQVVQNGTDPASTLANPNTVGGLQTWEAIYPALDSGGSFTSPAGSLIETIGTINPLATSSWQQNVFSVVNQESGAEDMWLRSVSRLTTDMTGSNTNIVPDKIQPVKDGIPVRRISVALNGWSPTTRYATDTTIIYDGMLFRALRASTGATPPSPGTPLNANPYFETAVTPWAGGNGATIAQSSVQSHQGTYSLLLTPNGTTANPYAAQTVTVAPGATYVYQGWVYLTSTWATTVLDIDWIDPFGAYITSSFSTVSVPANTWTLIQVTATAPANAATALLVAQLTGTPASSVLSYWDQVTLACAQTPEWAALSTDNRLRLMLSGYAAQNLTVGSNETVPVIPFVEWYDDGGNLIISNGQARVFPRTAVAGTPGGPPNLTFDSFCLGAGTYLSGRETDSNDQQWVTQLGMLLVSGFFGGSVYPATLGTRCMATVTGLAGVSGTPIWIGVTFASAPESGQDAGIVFRAASTSSYFRAGMTGLYIVSGGAATLIGNYSTACAPGDRLVVELNGNTITVFRNGAQVLTTSNSTNAAVTTHGIAVENTGV